MQAEKGAAAARISPWRAGLLFFISNLGLFCFLFLAFVRGCNYSALKQAAQISIKGWSYVKARRLRKCLFFFILSLEPRTRRRGLFYFLLLFVLQPVGSRLPCAPLGSQSAAGRRLVIPARSERLSRTSKSTAQDTNTVRVCPVSDLHNRGRSCLIRFPSPPHPHPLPPSRPRISAIKVGQDHMSPVNISPTHRPLVTPVWHVVVGLTEIKPSY